MGRARCTVDISPDGRFVAAGAADGSVRAAAQRSGLQGEAGGRRECARGRDPLKPSPPPAPPSPHATPPPSLPQVFVWDVKPPSSRRTSASGAPEPLARRASISGAGPPVTRLAGMKEQVAAVGWSYDGGTLVTADKTGGVAFWQCAGK
jgi:hypothetical protein